jgi:hypothetical protein
VPPLPAQTKGKVERPIRYLREGFFYGRSFVSDEDLNAQLLRWLETEANVRVHGTLKQRPVDRLEQERGLLGALAPRPYRSLVITPDPDRARPKAQAVPRVQVERRPLAAYAQIAGGVR